MYQARGYKEDTVLSLDLARLQPGLQTHVVKQLCGRISNHLLIGLEMHERVQDGLLFPLIYQMARDVYMPKNGHFVHPATTAMSADDGSAWREIGYTRSARTMLPPIDRST